MKTEKKLKKREIMNTTYAKIKLCRIMYATCISSKMQLICPPKFCITIVFNFSWDGCSTQEKWKTKIMQNFGGQISCIMGDVQVRIETMYRVKSLTEKTSSCSYRCSSRKKAWKNSGFYRIWILNSAIPVQHSTIFWVNKPAGSKSLSRFVIKPWKDADEIMNVWKLYMGTAGWRIHWKKIINYRPNCCSWEKNAWKKTGSCEFWTLDLCDTGAMLFQLN